MREIILDTETTGLSPHDGHRIVEIGCIEIINRMPTGNVFHVYINPERDMPPEAERVHGLSSIFLKDKPVFAQIADELMAFVANDPLVIHNAPFDLLFLDEELKKCQRPLLSQRHVVDTLLLARRKHPGQSNTLDALCARYSIDLSKRTKHGALLDCELLAQVYIELLGEKQAHLELKTTAQETQNMTVEARLQGREAPLHSRVGEKERAAHAALLKTFKAEPLWNNYKGTA